MVAWPSLNTSPPSLLYPPDCSKWWPRPILPGTLSHFAPNGRLVTIIELRGWLLQESGNEADPDWHYDIELDLEWLDQLRLPVEQLMLPGDPIRSLENGSWGVQGEVQSRSQFRVFNNWVDSIRAIYSKASIHIELDGWPYTINLDRGSPPKPTTWTFTNEIRGGSTVWPFDPRNPKAGDPQLAVGQYVRIIGSLVTDFPHMMWDQPSTTDLNVWGRTAVWQAHGPAEGPEVNLIKWMWHDIVNEHLEAHPARWNEVHSPDYVEVLPQKVRNLTVRCVAVVAQAAIGGGDVESLTADIPAPPRPTRWHAFTMRKHIGSATKPSTVRADNFDRIATSNAARVHVEVQGQDGLGHTVGLAGRFFAVYGVGWRALAPALHSAISRNGSTWLVAADGDGNLMARPGNAAAPFWPSDWVPMAQGRSLPGGHVTAVSRSPGQFDAFTVGTDKQVYTAAQAGGAWAGWWPIGGVTAPTGAPVHCVSRRLNNLDIFAADETGRIMSAAWEPSFTSWHGWWWIQNGRTAPGGHVTAVSRREDFLDIFNVGTDGRANTAAWNPPHGWHGWWPIGNASFPVGAPLTAISTSQDKLDLFGADLQGRVMTTHWEPGMAGWSAWQQVLGGVTSPGAPVAAVSRFPDMFEIFVIGTNGNVNSAFWAGPRSDGWWPIGDLKARPGTPIEAFSPAIDALVVVTSDEAGNVMSTNYSAGWTAWQNIS